MNFQKNDNKFILMNQYTIQRKIGECSTGEVFLGVKDNKSFALKRISISGQFTNSYTNQNEIQILSSLSHNNIIEMIEIARCSTQGER